MGYHTDWLEVWYSEENYCDAWHNEEPWCTYKNTNTTEGSSTASISNVDDYYEEWASYADYFQEELITVTAAADKMTNFHVYHYFEEQDWYYRYDSWSDHMLAATLRIDNLSQGVSVKDAEGNAAWKHPTDKNIRTHLENNEPNPEYQGEFGLSVTCDEDCDCFAHGYVTEWGE